MRTEEQVFRPVVGRLLQLAKLETRRVGDDPAAIDDRLGVARPASNVAPEGRNHFLTAF